MFEYRAARRILASIDDEALLLAALDDRSLPVVRRVLAGIAIGTPVADAYHALHDLQAAASLAAADLRGAAPEGERTGEPMLAHLLAQPSDDYLRALWFVVEPLGYEEAAAHLGWLLKLLEGRGVAARMATEAGRPIVHLPDDFDGSGVPPTIEPIELLIGSDSKPRYDG